MKKFLGLSVLLLLLLVALTGCGGNKATTGDETSDSDVVTTASIVDEGTAFESAISENGAWIICTLNDLTFDHDLVVVGQFYDKGDSANKSYRKIAPYTQDDDHNIIDRFTITAPKLIVQSPDTKFQGGTFVGDIYVEANGFSLQDATVEGNIYFANEEYQGTFVNTEGTVTGVTEVKANTGADVVTTASIVTEETAFESAIGENGVWIICTLNDLTFDHDLVVAGQFYDKGDSANKSYRKIAPYTQDDSHNILDRFTITAPKLTIQSPDTKFQGGTFVGDIYVEANGFSLQDATVEGNIYFASEEYQNSFVNTEGTVTGVTAVQ